MNIYNQQADSVPILCWGIAGCVGKWIGWCYSRFPWLLALLGNSQGPSHDQTLKASR